MQQEHCRSSQRIVRLPLTTSTTELTSPSGDLTKDERTEYLRAVKCILKAPSQLPAGKYPGAKSRYDDFTVVHMNMTPTVHSTANFMHWHRYYIWAYETALRTECNYKGYQPYWDWSKYSDLVNSPIFNGDEWSMGGNGDPVKHDGMNMGFNLPAGPGGGCVTTGPLAKYVQLSCSIIYDLAKTRQLDYTSRPARPNNGSQARHQSKSPC